jgi:hypothetical protein
MHEIPARLEPIPVGAPSARGRARYRPLPRSPPRGGGWRMARSAGPASGCPGDTAESIVEGRSEQCAAPSPGILRVSAGTGEGRATRLPGRRPGKAGTRQAPSQPAEARTAYWDRLLRSRRTIHALRASTFPARAEGPSPRPRTRPLSSPPRGASPGTRPSAPPQGRSAGEG